MANPFLSVQSYFGLAKEVTRGTAVSPPTIWLPISPNPVLTPNLTWLPDEALRGSPVKIYNDIPGVRFDGFECKGNVFSDTFPNLMLGLLGGPDVVTGTIAPYLHTIKVLNTASTGSQPPSYTAADIDQVVSGANAAKQLAASQFAEIQIDFAATGALSYTTKLVANPFTQIVVPASSFSTEVFIPAWNATATISGDPSPIIDGKMTITRSTASIFTLGQQGPFANWAGPIQVTGSLTLLVQSTDTTLTQGLGYNKQVVTLQFTDPQSSHNVKFTMSQVQFKDPKIDRSKDYIQATVNFEAESNSTDASTGFAPIQFSASTGQSTAY